MLDAVFSALKKGVPLMSLLKIKIYFSAVILGVFGWYVLDHRFFSDQTAKNNSTNVISVDPTVAHSEAITPETTPPDSSQRVMAPLSLSNGKVGVTNLPNEKINTAFGDAKPLEKAPLEVQRMVAEMTKKSPKPTYYGPASNKGFENAPKLEDAPKEVREIANHLEESTNKEKLAKTAAKGSAIAFSNALPLSQAPKEIQEVIQKTYLPSHQFGFQFRV